MPQTPDDPWAERIERTLKRYDETLLRRVSDKLFKPRNQWPAEELIERCVASVENAAVIDRRLQALDAHGRRALALMAASRQPIWRLGNLIELLAAIDTSADLRPAIALLESGLVYPVMMEHTASKVRDFETWIAAQAGSTPEVFAHPLVLARAGGEDLGLPECPDPVQIGSAAVHEADGLEWPLRVNVLWQQVRATPLRRTQTGDFFKRDLDRLRGDPLLNSPPADSLAESPDRGLLAAELAIVLGAVHETGGELKAMPNIPGAEGSLGDVLASFWSALPRLNAWTPQDGWRGAQGPGGNPFPSACLLALLLVGRLPDNGWTTPESVARWIVGRHPYWAGSSDKAVKQHAEAGLAGFLLGLAFQLRMLLAAKHGKSGWVVRLSPMGRWLLGQGDAPAAAPAFPQTVMVQPNLEIIAYRQGLSPSLIARLGQFGVWKTLGSACSLQLEPDSVYRALEAGQTFETIRQTLEQHGMRATPPPVIEALRTWSNKRERLCIYPAATLLEFGSPDDMNDALARGLPGTRLSDTLAVVANENDIDYRHFKLAGTRDYGLPPEKCVEVDADGVTLNVDMARSDLLLETEVLRFAEAIRKSGTNGRKQYRLTPASLNAGRESGLSLASMEEWFTQRTGRPLTPAARLLLTSATIAPPELRRQLVMHVDSTDTADGLLQWPETHSLIEARLGPTALLVAEKNIDALQARLGELGIRFRG